jgi:predicted phosphodiesterase
MTEDIKNIKPSIIKIFEDGGIKADAARFIQEKTGLGKTQSKEWARKIYDECRMFGSTDGDTVDSEEEEVEEEVKNLKSELEYSDKYVYNSEEDAYIFLLEKRFGKNVKISGEAVRGLVKNYSNYDGNPDTINQVSIRWGIPRNILVYILKILGVTHDSLPFTPEEFVERSEEELKDDYVTGKKFALYQKLQKNDWNQTKDNARKWDEFIVGKYNPFVEAIEEWTPPTIPQIIEKPLPQTNEKVFLCVLTDTHIGELTKTSWEGKTFNTKKAVENILNYISQIEAKLNEWTTVPSKCKLVIMGDILNSCVDGMTRKGTKLHNDLVNGDMFKVGLDVIITFVSALKQLFNVVNISCVAGNHDSFMISSVYYSSSRYFENVDGIVWNISDYWLDSFKVNNCYFIYSHGKDDNNHIALPNNKQKFESFVQSLLLKKVEELVGVKSKYFISGHLHSYEHIECNDFEKIQVPASVTADDFAEALGYITKARQNCFIVGKDHIEDTLHFYFE